MESPGEYLKREREMRGVALKDIANATKIRAGLLSALEKNDFNAMPAAPFVKGFIQAYSKYLGIDVQDALLRYESYMRSLAEGEVTAPQETAAKPAFISHFPSSITAIVIAVTLMLIASGIYIIVSKKETAEPVNSTLLSGQVENKDEAKGEPPSPPADSGNKKGLRSDTAASLPPKDINKTRETASDSREAGKAPFTLIIEATKPTWVKAEVDGQNPFEVSLREGEKVKWNAKEKFSILIGNAGGANVVFNGKPLGSLGGEGKVAKLILPHEKAGEGPVIKILNP